VCHGRVVRALKGGVPWSCRARRGVPWSRCAKSPSGGVPWPRCAKSPSGGVPWSCRARPEGRCGVVEVCQVPFRRCAKSEVCAMVEVCHGRGVPSPRCARSPSGGVPWPCRARPEGRCAKSAFRRCAKSPSGGVPWSRCAKSEVCHGGVPWSRFAKSPSGGVPSPRCAKSEVCHGRPNTRDTAVTPLQTLETSVTTHTSPFSVTSQRLKGPPPEGATHRSRHSS